MHLHFEMKKMSGRMPAAVGSRWLGPTGRSMLCVAREE